MNVIKNCEYCGKEFKTYKAWLRNGKAGKFCSVSCASKAVIRVKSQRVLLTCQECGKQYEVKRYRTKTSRYCSVECVRKNMPRGENHSSWKGGKYSRRGKQAIRLVIKRDGKCFECGSIKHLQGHHIKSVAEYPELVDNVDNIITLCSSCHSIRHPECSGMIRRPRKRSGVYRNCLVCNKEIYVRPCLAKTKWTCSMRCKSIMQTTWWRKENGEKENYRKEKQMDK